MSTFPQGTTAALDAFYTDGVGVAVDPVDPRISIVNPSLITVISNAIPTKISTGHFLFNYALAPTAPVGSWQAVWTGLINGVPSEGTEVFVVVEAGSISFEDNPGPDLGPCDPWPIAQPWCCITGATSITGAAFAAITGSAALSATEVLWAASGRRFGTCLATVYPCRKECGDAGWWDNGQWITPALIRGKWFNITCGMCMGDCSCTSVEIVDLPVPAAEIISVVIDGVTLPTSAYRVDNWRRLIRQDGGLWPLCQDRSRPPGSVGTWSVTLRVGAAVPHLGQVAMGELTCEFVKACAEDTSCRLPRKVIELARQGVTFRFPDVQEMLKDGLLGLEMSDHFIRTYNPNGLKVSPKVYSIDAPPASSPTWP